MAPVQQPRRSPARARMLPLLTLTLAGTMLAASGCSTATTMSGSSTMGPMASDAPSPDPRIGLRPGVADAGQAAWNMHLVSATAPQGKFVNGINSDLAFTGNYVFQGSFNGFQVWDISNPRMPTLRTGYYCPASQSDVSVYKNLLFVSGESRSTRLDCGAQGVTDTVSKERLLGIRIFDISDIEHPRNVGNVQTCRGSHTHTLLVDPKDADNVYVYVSGSSDVRSPTELAGCNLGPANDAKSALFRIEVIKVPLAHPERAAIVSSPRIFNDLMAPAIHGETAAERAEEARALAAARAHGGYVAMVHGVETVIPDMEVARALAGMVKARGGSGAPTAADSANLRTNLQMMVDKAMGPTRPRTGPTQCHDITVYPAIGLAGGACGGYGLLLDISDPAHPTRIGAAADSNFSYWHSATFNNDGTKVLFSDEWGGGMAPKCRSTDPKEWGADAIFTLSNRQMQFRSYYKLPVYQSATENCVAHNGSLIPIPGRDVMVQSWYQGGVSLFDWTDASHPREIGFFDRGPLDTTRVVLGGTWSSYWYNGMIYSSEIVRGLDILELTPSAWISQNEIDAAKTVHMDYLNAQGQPKLVWPASFALARAYADQLERSRGLSGGRLADIRLALASAESMSGSGRQDALNALASQLEGDASASGDAAKVRTLATTVRNLGAM